MIGARNIPRAATAEAIVAGQGILEGNREAVANMEIAVGIRWRHNNRKSFGIIYTVDTVVDTVIVAVLRKN